MLLHRGPKTELDCRDSRSVNDQTGQTSDGLLPARPKSAGATPYLHVVSSHPATGLMLASSEDPDAELVTRVGQGDEAAFRVLMTRKLTRTHALAARLLNDCALADDVAQDAFLQLWRKARTWRVGEARFDTWFHRVVLNLCTDRLRRRRVTFVAEPPEQVDQALAADGQILRDEAAARVRDAVSRLPPRQREAIVLQTYQELSNMEAAAVLGVSVEALESLLSRARRSLRSMLEEIKP